MVVVPVTRLDTQIVTRSDPRSRSRTIANVAVADCSSPAVWTCESTSVSGSSGDVIVRNGAAASSPVIRALALRVTSSSAGDVDDDQPAPEGVACLWGGGRGCERRGREARSRHRSRRMIRERLATAKRAQAETAIPPVFVARSPLRLGLAGRILLARF
jgi:hypothetical protein